MPGVSTSIHHFFPPGLCQPCHSSWLCFPPCSREDWPGRASFPRQVEGDSSPCPRCWGTSRGCAVETEPFLLLLPGLEAGQGWSQPGWCRGRAVGGAARPGHGTWSRRMGWPCPGQQRLPRLGRDSLGCPALQRGSGGGFRFGDAPRAWHGADPGWAAQGTPERRAVPGPGGISAGEAVPRAAVDGAGSK